VSSDDPDHADVGSERVLLEVPEPFSNNQGGLVSFGPDGYLYISLGDGGSNNDPFNSGQNTASLLGKILRIDVNTRAPASGAGAGNHCSMASPRTTLCRRKGQVGQRGVRKEIYAWGLREVWRYSWDRKTGDLWGGDVGEGTWEEVDLIVNGGN